MKRKAISLLSTFLIIAGLIMPGAGAYAAGGNGKGSDANSAPRANNNSYQVYENEVLTVDATNGVLSDDSDPDGDEITAVLVAGPSDGSLTLNADGSFIYTPNQNFSQADQFTYKARDVHGNESSAVKVNIAVLPKQAINVAPVAVNDSFTVDEDTTVTGNVLSNDTDANLDPLTATLIDGPAVGTLTLNANGSFTYQPVANSTLTVTFTYKANDGKVDSNLATVTINFNPVNDAPVAVADAYTTAEDTLLSGENVLTNDTDVDNAQLTAVLVAGPSHGTLVLNSDGTFTYAPDPNYHGPDSFTYKANDGSLDSGEVTVSLTVTPVNDAPVAVNDPPYTTGHNQTLTVTAINGVLVNDSDVDGDALTAQLVAGPTKGTLTLNANGTFVYTPNNGAEGSDTFTYTAFDGTVASNIATVTITVAAAPPVVTTGGGGGAIAPTNSLRVRVFDASDRNQGLLVPVAGATISLSSGHTLTTGIDGEAVFNYLPAGTYTATAAARDPQSPLTGEIQTGNASATFTADGQEETVSVVLAWNPAAATAPTAPAVPAAAPTPEPPPAPKPAPKGKVTVRVFDASSSLGGALRPIAGAEVALNGLVAGKTSAAGELEVKDLPLGDYLVLVSATNPALPGSSEFRNGMSLVTLTETELDEVATFLLQWEVASAAPGGTVAAETAQPGSITGRICSPKAPGAEISAQGPGGKTALVSIKSDGVLGVWREYVLKDLAPGTWTLTLTNADGKTVSQTVTVAAGSAVKANDFELACTGGNAAQAPLWPTFMGGLMVLAGLVLRFQRKGAHEAV